MTQLTLEVPQGPTFAADEMSAEREARLLIAGAFPDKGLAISPDDLDGIVDRFSADLVPVKIEHADSPLDPVGLVKSVWRDGAALMGRLAFPPDLSGFLQRRGIAKLSVGLERTPLSLAEVSLVLRPRVPTAALLSEGGGDGKDAEIVRLKRELRRQMVDVTVAALKAQGRLLPSGEPWARALLSVEPDDAARVTLSEGDAPAPVAEAFLRFLQTIPPLLRFGEVAPGGPNTDEQDAPVLTPEQEAFLRRTLGVDPAKVAETLAAERKEANAR